MGAGAGLSEEAAPGCRWTRLRGRSGECAGPERHRGCEWGQRDGRQCRKQTGSLGSERVQCGIWVYSDHVQKLWEAVDTIYGCFQNIALDGPASPNSTKIRVFLREQRQKQGDRAGATLGVPRVMTGSPGEAAGCGTHHFDSRSEPGTPGYEDYWNPAYQVQTAKKTWPKRVPRGHRCPRSGEGRKQQWGPRGGSPARGAPGEGGCHVARVPCAWLGDFCPRPYLGTQCPEVPALEGDWGSAAEEDLQVQDGRTEGWWNLRSGRKQIRHFSLKRALKQRPSWFSPYGAGVRT